MKRTAYEASELERARTTEVAKYFNPVVGQHDEIKGKRDKYDNPMGACYDLGKDGAFSEFKVLLGNFMGVAIPEPVKALKKKGFQVEETVSEMAFLSRLDWCDVAIFISGPSAPWTAGLTAADWGKRLLKFHHSGKGIWAWTDNDPYLHQANALLEPHFEVKMIGNTPGAKNLALSDSAMDPPTGHFKRHVISTGIKTLFEGITISYMTPLGPKKGGGDKYKYAPFKVLARSNDAEPVSCFLDNEFIDDAHGRMLVDGGFTKLYCNWEDAGTARYVVNGVIWLLGLEKKEGNTAQEGAPVWEWQNGSEWTPYHADDAALLEKKLKAEVETFSTKNLTFNAKHGTMYKFNLVGKMTQTNTVSDKVTKIRRREPSKNSKKKKEEDEEEEEVKPKKKKVAKEDDEEEEDEKPKKKTKSAPIKWVWEWQQGKKWNFYDVTDAEMLEEKNNVGKLSFKTRKLSFNKKHDTLYEFDLEDLTQTNSVSGTKTNIRRRKATADETEYAVG